MLQLDRFRTALRAFTERPQLVHVCNSAGAWRVKDRFDLVRPGIFLVGGEIGNDLPTPSPVVSVRARVVSLRRVRAGETVSYGGEWAADEETTVATIGIGYADGVPRATKGRAALLVQGRRVPVVGRITMDMTMVHLGPNAGDDIAVGDVVTVIGTDGAGEITLDEFAEWAGTISYEILVGLGSRRGAKAEAVAEAETVDADVAAKPKRRSRRKPSRPTKTAAAADRKDGGNGAEPIAPAAPTAPLAVPEPGPAVPQPPFAVAAKPSEAPNAAEDTETPKPPPETKRRGWWRLTE